MEYCRVCKQIDLKFQGESDVAINQCGTPEFMAPEVSVPIVSVSIMRVSIMSVSIESMLFTSRKRLHSIVTYLLPSIV